MFSAVWFYVGKKYVSYALLAVAAVCVVGGMSPFGLSFAATTALLCTLFEIASRGEVTVLQYFGVSFRRAAWPLVCVAAAPQLFVSPLFVITSGNFEQAVGASVLSLVGSLAAVLLAAYYLWQRREDAAYLCCLLGFVAAAALWALAILLLSLTVAR